jgi:hypothetical protein
MPRLLIKRIKLLISLIQDKSKSSAPMDEHFRIKLRNHLSELNNIYFLQLDNKDEYDNTIQKLNSRFEEIKMELQNFLENETNNSSGL